MVKIREIEQTYQEKVFDWIQRNYNPRVSQLQEFDQWVKSLQPADEAVIGSICEMLDLDIEDYLRVNTPYLTRDQIRILSSDGFKVGAHSMSHSLLSQLTIDELELEITGSCQVIQEITQNDSIPFAFPYYGHQIDKHLLNEVQTRNKEVGQFFDTNGIRESNGFIFDRIWADAPEWEHKEKSNLQSLIHLAYRDVLLDQLRRMGLYNNNNGRSM